MNYEVKKQILDKIKEYDKIFIFRHKRPDGDATGSTKGLHRILQLTYPDKEILLQNCDFSDYVAFLGKEDEIISEEEYKDALGIVVDTSVPDRISNPNYALCKELIKIDHHIPVEDYGCLKWVEEEASSACELIVKFYDTFRDELVLTKEAATYLYTGMVTDSGRFRFRGVCGDTLRYAAILLDLNIDIEIIYANLYMESFETLKFKLIKMKKSLNVFLIIKKQKKSSRMSSRLMNRLWTKKNMEAAHPTAAITDPAAAVVMADTAIRASMEMANPAMASMAVRIRPITMTGSVVSADLAVSEAMAAMVDTVTSKTAPAPVREIIPPTVPQTLICRQQPITLTAAIMKRPSMYSTA